MAAAVDSARAPLGAIGMRAFAIVFSLTAENSSGAAFMGTSFAWLVVSVTAWYVHRSARECGQLRWQRRRLDEAAEVSTRSITRRSKRRSQGESAEEAASSTPSYASRRLV